MQAKTKISNKGDLERKHTIIRALSHYAIELHKNDDFHNLEDVLYIMHEEAHALEVK